MNPFIRGGKEDSKETAKAVEPKSSMRIIVNLFYEPVDELKRMLVNNRDVYFPILGGAARPDVFASQWVKDHAQMDDSGDNISVHNKLLNEMTSIYWAWKHYLELGDPDYVGFNHYRRFFNLDDLKDRDEYDIICAEKTVCPMSVYGAYAIYHKKEDLDIASEVIKAENPEFWYDFRNSLGGNVLFSCNMFLMRKGLFFDYCKTMFPLLSRIAPKINLYGRDNYQKRAVCFIAERMTSAWIGGQALNNRKRIKQVPIEFHKEFKDNNLNERGTFG